MRKKIICILVCTVLIATTIVIVPEDSTVVASGGVEGESDIGLDYEFMWKITMDLANVTRDAYDPGDIIKGRFFGSKGDRYTSKYIKLPHYLSFLWLSLISFKIL